MSRFRKTRKQPNDDDGQADQSAGRARDRSASRKRSKTSSSSPYRHFASDIRYPTSWRHARDGPNSGADATWSLGIVIFIVVLVCLTCLLHSLDIMLRIFLLGEMLCCKFPQFFSRSAILVAILLPLGVQSHAEVALGLAVLSWLSTLDWVYAWSCVKQWFIRGELRETRS